MLGKVVIALALAAGSLAAPLFPRGYPEGSCVVDVKIEPCSDFNCELEGYHKIDTFLTQREHADSWSYVFYKTENEISERCVTSIKIFEEGSKPEGDGWYPAPHSAHEGVSEGGGPTLWSRRDTQHQLQGKVVDLVVIRPGRWANSTEDFTREAVNLGLGERAGSVEYPNWREWYAVSSGWVYLEYTTAGPREAITDIQVVSCPEGSIGTECGVDLLGKGWKRRDTDLNGPTANGSLVYLFTTTVPTESGDCVGSLKVVKDTGDNVLKTNLNDGTEGTPLYLQVGRTSGKEAGSCVTSVIPLDTSRHFAQAGYDAVLDEFDAPANLNDGNSSADPIFLYTSKEVFKAKGEKPELSFNSTGGFRIALFSDLHHSSYAPVCLDIPEQIESGCSEEYSFTFMKAALDMSRPDLVVLDGDLFAENKRQQDELKYPLLTDAAIAKAIHPIIERGLPFAVTWGNHDAEGSLLREELQRAMDAQPGFVGSRGLNHLDGIGNYALDIVKTAGSNEASHRLWFFDSRSYTYLPENGTSTGDYGQVEQSQVDWYASRADSKTKAMAFFHIPLAQISDLAGLNTSAITGVHGESVCPQGHGCDDEVDLTTPYIPLFDAFVKAGDVKATFSGHDHANDYVIDAGGIKMTYDGSAGYTAYSAGDANYNREMRVIDLAEWGNTATSFKIIDDILAGTVHRNESEPIVTLF